MASNGSDGSIIIDTELDSSGYKKGSDKLLSNVRDLTAKLNAVGDRAKSAFESMIPVLQDIATNTAQIYGSLTTQGQQAVATNNEVAASGQQAAQATQAAAQQTQGAVQQTSDALQQAGDRARDLGGALAGAMPSGDFTSQLNAAGRSCDALGNQLQRLDDAARIGLNTDGQMVRFQINVEKAQDRVAQLQQRMSELGSQRVPTADYEELATATQKAEQALFRLYDRRDMMQEMGVKENSAQWRRLEIQIRQAEDALTRYESQMAAMQSNGTAFVQGNDTAQYKQLQADLQGMVSRLAEYEAMAADFDTISDPAEQSEQSLKNVDRELRQKKPDAEQASSALSGLAAALKAAGAAALHAAGRLAKMGVQAVGKQVQGLTDKIKSFMNRGKQATLTSNGLVKALTSVKTMLKSRIKRMFISYLMSEIKSAMSGLVRYSSAFDAAISGMRNGITELGGNIAVAVSGLVNAVAPAITTIINLLSQAISYLNAFFAMLGGKSTVTVAKKQTDSYADSLGAAAGAAKDLDKANKTLGIDELNVVSEDDKGGGGGGKNPADLYEDVSIDSLLPDDVSDWFERIKAAFEAGDWYGIGNIISEGLNAAMGTVDNWINGTLRPVATTWAARIAQVLNGLVDGFDWTLMGKTLADGVNTVFDTLNTFLTTFNFDNLGAGIGKAINGLFSNVDWELVGTTFANKWNALISTLYGVVTTTDWGMVGTSVGTGISSLLTGIDWDKLGLTLVSGFNGVVSFLRDGIAAIKWFEIGSAVASGIKNALLNINWKAIGKTLSNAVIGLGSLIVGFVSKIDWTELGYSLVNGIGDAIKNVDWMGVIATLDTVAFSIVSGLVNLILGALAGIVDLLADGFAALGLDSIAGFLRGLADGIVGIGAWIKTNIIDPVVNGFKDLLGIHSPSTVFAEIGDFMIQGLLRGIKNAWTSITSFFTGAVAGLKNLLSNAWENIKTTASNAWNGLKTSVTTAFNNAKTELSTTASNIKSALSAAWDSVKTTASTKWGELKTTVSTTFENTKTALSTTAENVKATLSNAWDNIKTTASTKWESLKSTINTTFTNLKTSLIDTAENIKTDISTKWDSVKSAADTKWSDIKTKVLDLWNGLKTEVGKVDWKDIGTNLVEGVKQGILNAWDTFKSWVTNIFSSVINSVKSIFGIASPSKVFAKIGEYLDEGLVVGLKDGQRNVLSTVRNLAGSVTDAMGSASPELDIAATATSSNLSAVADILAGIAGTFAAIANTLASMGGLQVPAIASGRVVPYQTRLAPTGGAAGTDGLTTAMLSGNAEIIAVLREMLDRLERAINNSGGDLYIGDEQIVRSYDRGSEAQGVKVSRGAFANAY